MSIGPATYEKPESTSVYQPQGKKGVTASTKEGKDEGEGGGHTHEYFDKSLEDPAKKELTDLNDERANKTINDKKLNEKRSLDENMLLKRNIKSADISP